MYLGVVKSISRVVQRQTGIVRDITGGVKDFVLFLFFKCRELLLLLLVSYL